MVEEYLIIAAIRDILVNDSTVTNIVPANRIRAALTALPDDETFKIPMITIDCELEESDPQLDASTGTAAVLIWKKRDTTESGGSKYQLLVLGDKVDELLNKQIETLSAYDSDLNIHKFRRVSKSVDYLEDLDCWLYTLEYDLVAYES